MKLLLVAGASAVVTFIFASVSFFTREWVTATFDQVGIHLAQSVGIFPWWCISDETCSQFWNNAGGWGIACFLAMLFAVVWQLGALVELILALGHSRILIILADNHGPLWRFELGSAKLHRQILDCAYRETAESSGYSIRYRIAAFGAKAVAIVDLVDADAVTCVEFSELQSLKCT
ncbi:hypothetical protein Y032_0229g2912 [Ancylostoma ceylanicum]|uniref:Uncharacterized protein n=1 Tax=Ancylostoma ceylanicum TaxID=53326 RepID=A0A016SGX8_9BILA|nr:hypothetical protein Y032_0229g2912 [Ancylostoma ceylanicum]